jgi:hypothetical protein
MEVFMATICSPGKMEELIEEGYVMLGEIKARELKYRRIQHYNCERQNAQGDWYNTYLAKPEQVAYIDAVKSNACVTCPKKYWKSREGAEMRLTELRLSPSWDDSDSEIVRCNECSRYRITSNPRDFSSDHVVLVCEKKLIREKSSSVSGIHVVYNEFLEKHKTFIPKRYCIREDVGGVYIFNIPTSIWRVDYAKSLFMKGGEKHYCLLKEGKVIKGELKV